MRIIAGEFRSRPLRTPEDAEKTRPMPDRVREALFSLLRGHTEGQTVADVFAGTGSVGLEAVSRGAERCVFVERDREIASILKSNIESLEVRDRCDVIVGDALGPAALARCPRPLHLVFFDPPYPMVSESATRRRVFEQFARFVELLDPEGFAVLRTPWPFIERPEGQVGPDEAEDFPDGVEVEIDVEETAEPDSEVAGQHVAPPVDVDLTIRSAVGPETHVYGSTAVHLYARRTGD